MSDEELIARLRLYGSKFHHEFGHNDAADRIEALSDLNKKLTLKVSHYSDLLDDQLGTPCEQIRHKQEIEALEAKLATCEKYRDAYDEMGRIGTQAVRDLEAKLAKAVEALGRAKASIENGGGGGVIDVVWLDGPCPETLCDFIDAILAEIKGESHE